MSGSEYLVPELDTEMNYMDSQLEQSRQLDELTIDYLKYRNSLIRRSKIGPGSQLSASIDSLVKKKEKCDHMIRIINDDHYSEYRPFVFMRPNTIYSIPFPAICREMMAKLAFIVIFIDHNILKSPEYSLTTCIGELLKIICFIERKKPDLPYHLIVPPNTVIFIHLFFSIISRLEEYTNDPQLLSALASFEIMDYQFNIPFIEKDLKRLNKNIKDGGCLAKVYFELKNASVAVIIAEVLKEFSSAYSYLNGDLDLDHYYAHERIFFKGKRLCGVKFGFKDGLVTCETSEPQEMVKKFSKVPILTQTDVSSSISMFIDSKLDQDENDNILLLEETYQKQGLQFKPKVIATTSAKKSNTLQFVPDTADFFFKLT